MIITAIEAGENKKYTIYLNDEPAFELYKSEIKSCNIAKGMELEEELHQRILYEIVGKRAKKRAMYILEKRDKTEKQLREKLMENRYPPEAVECAIDYVKSYGYIDDESYARRYIEYRCKHKSYKQLKMELYVKGISNEIIDRIFQDMQEEEFYAIRTMILKKSCEPWTLEAEKQQKLKMSLMRKGFPYSKIDKVFSQLKEEQNSKTFLK